MADIRKKTGSKGVRYQVRYPSAAAKSGYAYKNFRTMKEARAFLQSGEAQRASSALSTDIRTVHQAIDRWLEVCEKIGRDGREAVEPETLKEYVRRARVMASYHWIKPLQDLLPSDIVSFRNWLLSNYTRDLARRTLSSFHSVLIEMRRAGHMRHDPAAGITIRSDGRNEDHDSDIHIPTDRDMQAILSATDRMGAKNDFMAARWARYRPMIYLAAFTGMRPSEYRGLAWQHILPDRVQVRQRADKSGRIGPVKSKAARREIFLPARVADMISEWKCICRPLQEDIVFPTSSGKPILPSNFFHRAWKPLMKEAGFCENLPSGADQVMYNLYCLRHYYAGKLIERGKDLKFIQTTMGHSKIEITLNVYGHLIRGREEEYRDTAEELFSSIVE